MILKEKLDSLCHINSGGTPSRGIAEYYGGKIPWAKIRDIEKSNGVIYSTEEYITEAGLESIGNRIFPKGTLLFAMYGSVGKVALCGVELSTNQAILGIRLKQEAKEKLDLEYLKYWFQVNLLFFKSRAVGGILKNLSATIVKDFDIPLPSITDQKRIAKVLSECEALIQKRKESIDLLDDLLQSKFNEMFYNEVFLIKTIEEVSLNIIDCPHSTPKYLDSVSDYPCIRTSEIKNGQIDWTSMKYTDHDGYIQRVERLVPQEGDIIFAREGSVGDAAIIPKNVNLSLGQRVMMFRINPDLANPEYIWAFIKSDKTQHIIKSRSIGATVSRINISEVRKIQCPIPPLEIQNQFAEIVKQIGTLKTNLLLSLNELENLYGSISQRAFNGELDLSKIDISDMEDLKKKVIEAVKEDITEEQFEDLMDSFEHTLPTGEVPSNRERDIRNISIREYLGFSKEIQEENENIEFAYMDKDFFYQFILTKGFPTGFFEIRDLEEYARRYFLKGTGFEFTYENWKTIIFRFIGAKQPIIEQVFDEYDKTIKLKLTDEAFKV